ncbi:MAG TPA: NAD+ synthase [Planctomycetota bacterium]|nr:NAD+ synthase [Planctomycetota bacterium]
MDRPGLSLAIDTALVERLLVQFLREEIHSAGFTRAVLGVSGGIDSAVVAALAARALGANNVLGVLLPYRESTPQSEIDGILLCDTLGIRRDKVDISAMADGYISLAPKMDRLRRGNVLARCRMIVLYDRAASDKALVMGTSNKTELLLGYTTQFGDSASALNPIGDLYKNQVYQLARHLKMPEALVTKAPSADLFAGQTDESELGFTYEAVDRLLYLMVDERYSEDDLLRAGFELAFVRKIVARIASTQFKRVPPIIAKLSQRTVNQDFRYLRDWGR